MIQQLIHRFLKRRHFWRYASFGEVAELYASRMMTIFAFRFVMAFGSVYLYKLGYEVAEIALFWALYYAVKTVSAGGAAFVVARIGPKHGLLVANILLAAGLACLMMAPVFSLPAIIAWCFVQGIGGTLNNLCYVTDFSKVKHANHAGKEISYMNIVEKVAAGLSPLIGGVVATLFGPLWAFALSIALFVLSAVPLFHSAEPVKTHQKISLRGYPWRQTWRSIRANSALGIDIVASGIAWNLFISVAIFANDGDELYAKIGAFTSVSLVVALATSYLFGKLVDHRQGLLLLRSSVIINSLLHLLRPSVSTATGIVLTNAANEAVSTGYTLAFTRGEFDLADTPGYRIVYLSLMEVAGNAGATVAALAMALFATLYGSAEGLMVFYVFAAFATLLIATPRFPLYKR